MHFVRRPDDGERSRVLKVGLHVFHGIGKEQSAYLVKIGETPVIARVDGGRVAIPARCRGLTNRSICFLCFLLSVLSVPSVFLLSVLSVPSVALVLGIKSGPMKQSRRKFINVAGTAVAAVAGASTLDAADLIAQTPQPSAATAT